MSNLKLEVVLSAIDKATAPFKNMTMSAQKLSQNLSAAKKEIKSLENQKGLIDNYRKIKNQFQENTIQFQHAKQKAALLRQELESHSSPTRKMQTEYNKAQREVEKLASRQGELTGKLKNSKAALTEAGIAVTKLKSAEQGLTDQIKKQNQVLTEQETKLKKVERVAKMSAKNRAQYDKTMSFSNGLSMAGATSAATGYMIGRPMMGAVNIATEFDATMSKVQALTRLQKDSAELEKLRVQARQLGADTMFSANDAAEGQAFLAMAGFKPEDIMAAMPGLLDVAKAGNVELGRTSDIASNILSGMNIPANDMGRVADVLVGTFTRSNNSLEMIGEAMTYAAPKAAELGVSLETTAAMMGKLGDAGIQASMGGTGVRRMLSRLSAPNKAAREAMEMLNVSAADANGKLRDVPELLKEIYDKSRKLTDVQRSALFKDIAGETGAGAMSVLVEKAGSGELQQLVTDLQNAKGEAAKVAKTMADNLTGDWDEFTSSVEDVSIELVESQGSALRELVQASAQAVTAFGKWAKENPALVSTLVKVAAVSAGLLVGFGGLAFTVSGLIAPFAMMRYAFNGLGINIFSVLSGASKLSPMFNMLKMGIMSVGRAFLMNPIGLAITAVIVGLYLLWRHWDTVKAALISGWQWIDNLFAENPILNFIFPFIGAARALVNNWDAVKTHLLASWMMLQDVGAAIWEGIKTGVTVAWQDLCWYIKNTTPLGFIVSNWDTIKSYLSKIDLKNIAKGIMDKFLTPIKDGIERLRTLWRGVNGIFNSSAAGSFFNGSAPRPAVATPSSGGKGFVSSGGYLGGRGFVSTQNHNNYEINVHAKTDASAADIGREVEAAMNRAEQQKARNNRVSMQDRD